jgi:TolB-like protein
VSLFLDVSSEPAVFRFERVALDVRRGVLLIDGAERRPRPKSYALPRFLVENAGRLLDRDAIMRAVWPDVFATDDSIARCIKEIRRALDDETSRLPRTLPRRGYMFAAQVQRGEPGTALAPGSADPALPDKPSIALLPFQNMSGDPDQDYFADGTVEDITTALSRIRWLSVIARNSAFSYKGLAVDIRQVSREPGVRYVVEGSVRKSGNRVRVTAQLIGASAGAHPWADRYDRELHDIFTVRDDIAASVASTIEPALAEAEQQRVPRKPPERLDAWEAYRRGQRRVSRGSARAPTPRHARQPARSADLSLEVLDRNDPVFRARLRHRAGVAVGGGAPAAGYSHPRAYIVACLARLGRLDEAANALDRLRREFPDDMPRMFQRPPWILPAHWAPRTEALRLVSGAAG